MMFHLVAVGRLTSADLQSVCDAYTRRIRRYTQFSIHELRGSRATRDTTAVLETERTQILSAVEPIPTSVLLTRDGSQHSSGELSERLRVWRERARDVAFVLGGAFGVHPDVREACAEAISLSRMTLPHDLARLILLEQLYRGFSILRGEPYHKGERRQFTR
jgi:23S rRNA (pseudouridine1915-N3)-methyltransferase